MTTAKKIDFWFDPACPFTWRTSRWLVDVAGQRGIDVRWHVMSLAILNEGKEIPPQYQEIMAKGRITVRMLQAVRDGHGSDALGRLYAELGSRLHEQGRELDADLHREALTAAGLPEELATAGDDETHQAAVAASHRAGQERVGEDAGSPITAVDDGPGFFGPIVVPAPTGEQASRLLDALLLASSVPAFSELKRARQGV